MAEWQGGLQDQNEGRDPFALDTVLADFLKTSARSPVGVRDATDDDDSGAHSDDLVSVGEGQTTGNPAARHHVPLVAPWGARSTPLLPLAFRNAFSSETAPLAVSSFFGAELLVGELDGSAWARIDVHTLPSEVVSDLIRFFESRFDAVVGQAAFSRPPNSELGQLPLSARARNAIRRGGFTSALPHRSSGRGTVTFGEIFSLPSVGIRTVLELSCVLEAAETLAVPLVRPTATELARKELTELASLIALPEEDSEFDPAVIKNLLEHLREVAAWAVGEMDLANLADLLSVAPDGWPSELRSRWENILATDLRVVAGSRVADYSVPRLTASLLESFDERQRMVMDERVFIRSRGPTLEELGEKLGVTRERVRQVQVKAERLLRDSLTERKYLPLRRRAIRLREAVGSAIPAREVPDILDRATSDFQPLVRTAAGDLLLWLAGPYRSDNDWLIREDMQEELRVASVQLRESEDQGGVIPASAMSRILGDVGIDERHQLEWSEQFASVRPTQYGLLRWDGNTLEKLERMLLARGAPANVEQLLEECDLDRSERGIRNRLLEDPRFVRINRQCDFAHRRWEFDEYSGIADEIAEAIERVGGSATGQHLVEDISRRFGVARASVNTYLSAPMFVTEGGQVRLRRDDEAYIIEGNLASCRGAYRPNDQLVCLLISVDQELLRGSGRAIPGAVAAVLGVRPGQPRAFSTGPGLLTVTWPVTAAFGATLGSVRGLAADVGAVEGDQLRLDFDIADGLVSAHRLPLPLDLPVPAESLRLLTGVDIGDDPVGRMAAALGVTSGEVRRCLLERGDEFVADLLPAQQIDPGLDSALSELAKVLEELS